MDCLVEGKDGHKKYRSGLFIKDREYGFWLRFAVLGGIGVANLIGHFDPDSRGKVPDMLDVFNHAPNAAQTWELSFLTAMAVGKIANRLTNSREKLFAGIYSSGIAASLAANTLAETKWGIRLINLENYSITPPVADPVDWVYGVVGGLIGTSLVTVAEIPQHIEE